MYDYIIVGGGSAGCLLANRLSENPENQVLLLEAGPSDSNPFFKMPMGMTAIYRNAKYVWKFWSRNQKSQNNRNIYCVQGKTLGGGSAVNGMLYVRGNAWDYDNWESLGNKGWGYAEMLKHFIACEHNENFNDEYHGQDGGLNVQHVAKPHSHAERWLLAALEAGYTFNPDFNGASQEGVGMYQVTMKKAQRCSSARAFLHPVKDRPNLTIVTNAQTQKINFDESGGTNNTNNTPESKPKAVSVTYSVKGKEIIAEARNEIIISAGAFNSPKLLMLSGIGDKSQLEQQNIKVLKNLPGVGKNLQEHVDMVITVKSHIKDTVAFNLSNYVQIVWGFVDYFRKKDTGYLSKTIVDAGGFIKSSADKETPDIQFQTLTSLFNDHGFDLGIVRDSGYSTHVTLLRPRSRGEVLLQSNKVEDHPIINLNLLSNEDDLQDLMLGVRKGREILAQQAYQKHHKEELFPGENVTTDEALKESIRNKACHIYHPVGTCKMGSDDMAVVDDQLKVHGVSHLRVVDASIMPSIVSGNTNAPTMAIASKAAELILKSQ